MIEDAQRIFDYLPIEAGSENLYIQHLSGAFQTVNEKDEPTKAFSILPYHLLFMFAVQYWVYRISAWNNVEYLKVLQGCRTYRKEDRKILISNAPIPNTTGVIPLNSSVRNLSKINEVHLFHFFRVLGLDEEVIKQAEVIVNIRGTYAHANGNIEKNIEERIDEYLAILREIQKCMVPVNKDVQNWVNEIEEGEFPLDDFFTERFLQSQFSPQDFGDIIASFLESDKLDFDQWQYVVDRGFDLSREKNIVALRNIAKDDLCSEEKRFNVIQALFEQGEINDEVDIPINANIMDLLQLNNQQKTELRAARIYIKNKQYDDHFINFKIEKQNSNIDVIYKPKNLKFQVVSVDGSPYKLLKNGIYEYSLSAIDTCRIYIEEPIVKKTLKYAGRGVDDVILLIHSLNKPLTDKIWEQVIQDNQSSIKDLAQKSGFKEICLCFDSKGEIIKLY